MKVKICGIMDIETAKFAVLQGADALGFVFAESKRKISLEKAKEISEQLPSTILKVGVFVNEYPDIVQDIVEEAKLTGVQFHGDETPEYCNSFSVQVIKAISVATREDLEKIHGYQSDYILLDSPKGKYRGGNGLTFDWRMLNGFDADKKKMILAGGLDIENVSDAIRTIRPYMVDVSSGVETNGRKNLEKIRFFIERAKSREDGR